jgi:AraC-like DNA-binding protein
MPASGTYIFTSAECFQASFRGMLDLILPQAREFSARLTRIELLSLVLLRVQEAQSHVAHVSLPSESVFVTFPTQRGSLLICDGVGLQFGDIMFHSRGERFHQRTIAASRWGSISLPPAALMTFSRTIAGRDLVPPAAGQVLRPPPADRLQLLRLHAQAGRIAETNLNQIGHPEVARALEQDLGLALIRCLETSAPPNVSAGMRHQARIMAQFEAMLAANPGRLLRTREICGTIGVSAQTLRTCCSKLLGLSPSRYQHLRRLKLARMELLRTDPAALNSGEVAKGYGFQDFRRFVTEYWSVYGELPPNCGDPPPSAE